MPGTACLPPAAGRKAAAAAGVTHSPVSLQVDPRAFHILSHWNQNYTMETVLVELRKEMCELCCASVVGGCAAATTACLEELYQALLPS